MTRLKQACLDVSLLPDNIKEVMTDMNERIRKRKKKGKRFTDQEIEALFTCLRNIANQAADEVYECPVCLLPQTPNDIRVIRMCKHPFCVKCMDSHIAAERQLGLAHAR